MIEWKQTGDDPNDLIAEINGDTLRVEQMDMGYYWWAVYFNGSDYHSYDESGVTLEDAKEKCSLKYFSLKYPVK